MNDLCDFLQVSDRSDLRLFCFSEDLFNFEKGFEKVNFGYFSQYIIEFIFRLVLDIIIGNYLLDLRIMGDRVKRDRKIGILEMVIFFGGNVEKEWFERVLGDKEIIDMFNYENFVRMLRIRLINDFILKYQNVLGVSNFLDWKLKIVIFWSFFKVQFDIFLEEKFLIKLLYLIMYFKQVGEFIVVY